MQVLRKMLFNTQKPFVIRNYGHDHEWLSLVAMSLQDPTNIIYVTSGLDGSENLPWTRHTDTNNSNCKILGS